MANKFICFLALFIIISCGNNTDTSSKNKNTSDMEESKFYLLTGNISGEEASMYLYLNEKKNTISGYYYTKNKKAMITGKINNKKINLQEIDENNNIHANIVGVLNDNVDFNAEIRYEEANEVKDMEFSLNRNIPVYYADIVDYYKNDNIGNAIFSYHKTLLLFTKNNEISSTDMESSLNYAKEECENYYNEWKTLIADGVNSNASYEIDYTVNVGYIDNRVIALDNYSYVYTAGAHGEKVSIQEVFSLESSNLITIRDLISDFNNNDLISVMRDKILKTGSTKEDYFNFNDITLESSSFRILPNSINFIWQTYDIAPYSTGVTEISFSFDELKPYVREDSPLYYLFL